MGFVGILQLLLPPRSGHGRWENDGTWMKMTITQIGVPSLFRQPWAYLGLTESPKTQNCLKHFTAWLDLYLSIAWTRLWFEIFLYLLYSTSPKFGSMFGRIFNAYLKYPKIIDTHSRFKSQVWSILLLNNGPQPDLLAPSPSPFGGVDKTALGWFLTGGATHWTAGGLQVREQRVRFGDFSTVDCLVN